MTVPGSRFLVPGSLVPGSRLSGALVSGALVSGALVAMLALGAGLAAQSVPEIAFESNADVLKLPEMMNFGEVAGVATNSKGHVFVYTRTGPANEIGRAHV